MDTRRYPRTPKPRKRSPSPVEELIQRKLSAKRRRTGLRKTEDCNSVLNADEDKTRDILDIIDTTHNARAVAEDDKVKFVEVADRGVDESEEDCVSATSSIASGPSVLYEKPKKQRPLQGLCSACRKLYQRAKRMKAPIKNKLLDNEPQSLTCDQWVLIKNWRPRRMPNVRGKLLTHVQVLKKRLKVKKGTKCTDQHVGESSACLRPHTFLQRNLRRRVRVPVKKERSRNLRKRMRDEPRGPCITKQLHVSLQRLSSNVLNRVDKNGLRPTEGHSSSPDFEARGYCETDNRAEYNFETVEVIPSSVTMKTTKPNEVLPKKKAQKKTGGFRDLLAQLRGNSSMIVRETC
ncbi:hypothetical protein L3Q82_021762 [Scortum barcoo]|uniref:Uncharacterized protein n=1 Tax=Scortum barcoo TaxID=214431 RepID=A0ACB8X695_9TELE|nr:hypothetical protein L3Q82_021762 [Scortum barcoo]